MKEIYGINDINNPDSKTERWRVRYIFCLEDFIKEKQFTIRYNYRVNPIPSVFLEKHNLYRDYLIKKNQKPKTISTKLSRLKRFLIFLDNNEITEFNQITIATVVDFVDSLHYSKTYCNNILITIRDFFNCPSFSKEFINNLQDSFDTISSNRYEQLPSLYSDEEIRKIISTIDRSTNQGKKEYAIIALAAELALRVSDIRNLKIDNIKWEKNTIEIYQEKTNEFLEIFMTDNIKWALLDYLMNVRSKSNYNHVFIRSRAPYIPYSDTANFYDIINKYIKLSDINIEARHHGLHSCRHGLATRLMSEGTPLPIISEALGHKFGNVTKDYIRLDISQLRLVAMEVPCNV